MKKFLFILVLIGSMVCVNAKEVNVLNVLDKYIAAWNEHNVEKIDSFYADDVTWYDLGYDYTTRGKKEVSEAIIAAFLGSVDGMYWVRNDAVLISKNTLVYEWVYGGVFNGKWEGTTIQNKKFEIKGVSITTVNQDGKIISHKDYYNLLDLKKQLGLL